MRIRVVSHPDISSFLDIYLLIGFKTGAFWALRPFVFRENEVFLNLTLGLAHALIRESFSPFYY